MSAIIIQSLIQYLIANKQNAQMLKKLTKEIKSILAEHTAKSAKWQLIIS